MILSRAVNHRKSEIISLSMQIRNESQFCLAGNPLKLPVICPGGQRDPCNNATPERRDRLWLINGLAVVLLTLLGAASEAVGYDRMLKTNTSKRREHSLFRQGCMVYDLIPTTPERWLQPLMLAFTRLLDQQPLVSRTLGLV